MIVIACLRVLCTRAHHKGAPVDAIHRRAMVLCPDVPTEAHSTLETALERAVERARQEGLTVLVAGGLFLAAEAAEVLRGGDPSALAFF